MHQSVHCMEKIFNKNYHSIFFPLRRGEGRENNGLFYSMLGLSNVFKSVIFLDQFSQENIKLQSSDFWSATGNRGERWNVPVDRKNCFHILDEKWGVLAKMRNYFWHLRSLLQPSLYIIWRWRRNDNYNISFYFQSKFLFENKIGNFLVLYTTSRDISPSLNCQQLQLQVW